MSISFLNQLAQPRPDPGGGAAAAYSAGVGLALAIKVIRLEMGRPRHDKAQRDFWAEQLAATRGLVRTFQRLRQADVEAYRVMAQALSEGRQGPSLRQTVEEATRVPWRIMEESVAALESVGKVGEHCRPQLISDLLVAAEILGGALQGAHHIASANLPLMPTSGQRQEWAARLAQTSHQGLEATLKVRSRLLARAHAAPHSG
jgi:formiminotetrahydrofolate cyclodeaminase